MSAHLGGLGRVEQGAADEGVVEVKNKCLARAAIRAGPLRRQQRPVAATRDFRNVRQAREEVQVLRSFLCLPPSRARSLSKHPLSRPLPCG